VPVTVLSQPLALATDHIQRARTTGLPRGGVIQFIEAGRFLYAVTSRHLTRVIHTLPISSLS
jgi:hypothetical protein